MEYFFSSGYNKSGTTFLQMLLDSHPQVGCTPEHHIKTIIKSLHEMNERYESLIKLFDDRTARQGVRYRPGPTMQSALKAILMELFTENRLDGLHATGISDNWIFEFLPLLNTLLPEAHYLFIIRDPRGIATSLYHHLARTEPHRVQAIGINEFAKNFGGLWSRHIQEIDHFGKSHPSRVNTVRYEDLTGSYRIVSLQRLLKRLGVRSDEDLVFEMYRKVEEFRTKSTLDGKNKFFRTIGPNTWQEELQKTTQIAIYRRCAREMENHGYH
jgi:hypothetical protein